MLPVLNSLPFFWIQQFSVKSLQPSQKKLYKKSCYNFMQLFAQWNLLFGQILQLPLKLNMCICRLGTKWNNGRRKYSNSFLMLHFRTYPLQTYTDSIGQVVIPLWADVPCLIAGCRCFAMQSHWHNMFPYRHTYVFFNCARTLALRNYLFVELTIAQEFSVQKIVL